MSRRLYMLTDQQMGRIAAYLPKPRGWPRRGIPAVARVDNEKTAASRGAGSWGEFNPTYRRFAKQLKFHVDACAPRQPQTKGKVERLPRLLRRHAPILRHAHRRSFFSPGTQRYAVDFSYSASSTRMSRRQSPPCA